MTAERPRRFLLVTTVFLVLGGLVSVFPAMMSPMMFDAPGSTSNPVTQLLFWSVFTCPVVCVVALASSWILYACRQSRVACWVAVVPILNVMLGAGALGYLVAFNGGRFSG